MDPNATPPVQSVAGSSTSQAGMSGTPTQGHQHQVVHEEPMDGQNKKKRKRKKTDPKKPPQDRFIRS